MARCRATPPFFVPARSPVPSNNSTGTSPISKPMRCGAKVITSRRMLRADTDGPANSASSLDALA